MGMYDNQNTQAPSDDYNSVPATGGGFDAFDQIANSNPNEGGVYPVAGLYPVLCVDVLKMIQTRKGETMFIAELEILQSEVVDRPVGSKMSWVANFKHDAAPGNVRMFLAAVMGVQIGEVDAQGSKLAVSDQNPCNKRLVKLTASMTTTKAGNPFTLCRWEALPEVVQAQCEKFRNDAGYAPF